MQSKLERNIANGLFFFETMLVIDGMIQHKQLHLKRVQRTIDFLEAPDLIEGVPSIDWFSNKLTDETPMMGIKRLRVDFIFDGGSFKTRSISSELATYPDYFNLAFDERAIRHSKDPFWRYKFAGWQRNLFFLDHLPNEADDIIFVNEADEICETTRANIYLQHDDKLITPPLKSGVLDGVYRTFLLEKKEIIIGNKKFIVKEEIIKKSDLNTRSELFISNGLMGLRHAKLV